PAVAGHGSWSGWCGLEARAHRTVKCSPPNMDATLTRSEREALKAVYRLTRDGVPAPTGGAAEARGVSPAPATAVVKRLAARDLVTHRRYHGVELTDAGSRAAVAAIRRHRIVERFLSDMLGYAWNEADRLATSF